ncbi:hypothetical protein OPQ81_004529 [Rhizoctonia solani]|nr:hypothetical protein OPQ81_004529 [Rhizoctonia solani]
MESADLARWQRFASKGGIGKSTALVDRIAERDGDLMFLKDDEIVVLMQLPQAGYYLGFCEGVVGRFAIADVQVHGKLKRAVMARRPPLRPVVPHTTTLLPIRASTNESRAPDAYLNDDSAGVSAWLASQPSPSQENVPITETGPEPPEPQRTELISSPHPSSPLLTRDSSIRVNTETSSSHPDPQLQRASPSSPSPSSRNRPPLHVNTSPPAASANRESQSLASLVSTEASPLSDSSVYSFHRRPNDAEMDREPEYGERVPQFQSQEHVRRSEAGIVQGFTSASQQAPNDAETESRVDMESSISRASTPSVGDPFQHDQPSISSQLSSPTQLRVPPRSTSNLQPDTTNSSLTSPEVVKTPHGEGDLGLDAQVEEEEHEGSLYSAGRESKYSTLGAGIGLSLMGGLLGAGGGDSDSESDYGQPSEDGDSGRSELYGEGVDRKPSQDGPIGEENQAPEDGNQIPDDLVRRAGSMVRQSRSGDVTPHGTGSVTPLNGVGLPASQSPSSTNSRSSTPPFGFELDPTNNVSQEVQNTDQVTADSANDLRATAENTKPPMESVPGSPISRTTNPTMRRRFNHLAPPKPQVPPSSGDTFPRYSDERQLDDDDDFDLPPVRPPYHRASTSIRSITSSDAGGYYDDAIYDHYRYSQISMAARSIRMSLTGAEDVPPLPSGSDLERESGIAARRDRQFAPLNLSPKSGPQGSLSSPSSQIQFSPGLNGPRSPSVRSPLGPGEPTSPRSMGTDISPLAAGPILQAQMATRGNADGIGGHETQSGQADKKSLLSLTTTGLSTEAASTEIEKLATSPGGLVLPLSPTGSVPPSPLSSNLASTLRQVIEQQRAPEPGLQTPLQAEIIDEEKAHARKPCGGPTNHPPTGPQHMLLHDALSLVAQRLRTTGMVGGTPTIHGRTHSDLSLSWTPVPISFVFDPDGRSIPMVNRAAFVPQRVVGGAQRSASMSVHSGPTTDSPASGSEHVGSKLRPRSRSFSDVPSEQLATYKGVGQQSAPQTPTQSVTPGRTGGPTSITPSPLAQPPTPGPTQGSTSPIKPQARVDTPLRSPTSPPTSPVKQIAPVLPSPSTSSSIKGPFRGLRQVASNTMMRVGLQGSISSMPTRQSSDNFHRSPVDSQRKLSEEVSRPNASATNVNSPSPPSASTSPMASSNISLTSKVSSTGLRLAGGNRPTTDTPTTPLSPITSAQPTEETVHYNDMDFDMVKPKRSRVSIVRTRTSR